MHVLIVDDDEMNLKVLRAGLEAEGVTTIQAENGIEALDILAKQEVDGVISDVMMPKMDGFTLCRKVRTENKLKSLPFIIYTMTHISPEDRRIAATCGADDFIMKPAPASELIGALHRAVSAQSESPVAEPIASELDIGKSYGSLLTAKLKEKNSELAILEYANRELSEFVRIAAHDLQEPISTIIGFGGILSTSAPNLNDETRVLLGKMLLAAQRLSTLVRQLLEYSRQVGKERLPQPVDLQRLMADISEDLHGLISECNGAVEFHNLPVVLADEVHMRHLFQNLLANALKFRKKNESPRVRVSAKFSQHGYAVVRVEDNGIGIDREHFDTIFKPFARLHTRAEYEGTGIGLAICKKVVERSSGMISVESQPGAGSVFIVTLPTPAAEEEAATGEDQRALSA